MKRRTEHLVEKRDGRREFLRATKLARSIHLALFGIGVDEDWRALELATVVLEGLRQKRRDAVVAATAGKPVAGRSGAGRPGAGRSGAGRSAAAGKSGAGNVAAAKSEGAEVVLTTAELADAVQHILVVTGQPAAAVSYGAVQAERARRRVAVATLPRATGGARAPSSSQPAAQSAAQAAAANRLGGRWQGEN